jgi:capsular exopolysaccharide synthesis family protein
MGVIPAPASIRKNSLLEHIIEKPASGIAEAVRNLRTTVQLSNMDLAPQVIMVTSSVPDEGKTSIATTLALTSIMLGKRVLLIDGDLRCGKIKEQFKIESEDGLITLLSGEASFDEIVYHDDRTELDVLIGEESKAVAVDVFASKRYEAFINEMRKKYHFIVIDTPPVLAVPDARVIAQSVDSIIYVVRWNSTKRRMIQAGLNLLHDVNAAVVGVALSRVDLKRMTRDGYYGYGYGYEARNVEKYYTN